MVNRATGVDALTEVAGYLRCPSCSTTECETTLAFHGKPETISALTCTSCHQSYPLTDGVVDLGAAGLSSVGDRPYEGRWAAVYGWVMDRPSRQRLDSWLLGLDVRRYYREVIARLDACGDGPHLEVPSGNLPFLGLTDGYRTGGPWIFVDLSQTMLGKLSRKVSAANTTGHVLVRADACSLPVVDGQMKSIVSLFGLHCFHDKGAVFAEWRRCLQPAGRLVFSTLTSDGSALSRFYYRLNQQDGTFAPATSSARIVALARQHGFEIEDELRLGSVLLCTASPRTADRTE